MSIHGHFWTIVPYVADAVRPIAPPSSIDWSAVVDDSVAGPITLRGRFADVDGARDALVIVHGLGGNAESGYVRRAASAAYAAGLPSLRLNLRGADGSGQDFYHAGLTADLEAALRSDTLARFDHVFVLGFSLGGHVALRFALAPTDPRVRAVASVCAPLDLGACVRNFDEPRAWVYRRHVLAGMKAQYVEVAKRRPMPVAAQTALAITRVRDWDDRIVAPRHGFSGADDYYANASVGPRLPDLALPARIVVAEHDPMIPIETLRPSLLASGVRADIRFVPRGGHVGFPPAERFGIFGWFREHASS